MRPTTYIPATSEHAHKGTYIFFCASSSPILKENGGMTGESRRRAGGKTRGIHGCGISDHRVTSTGKRPAQYEKRTSNRRILGYLLTALTAICIPIMTAVLTSYTKSALGQGSGSSLS